MYVNCDNIDLLFTTASAQAAVLMVIFLFTWIHTEIFGDYLASFFAGRTYIVCCHNDTAAAQQQQELQ